MEIELLTETEKLVLLTYAGGFTKRETGEKLGMTYDTVKTHTKNIYAKLKAECGIMALGVAVSSNQITPHELFIFYATRYHFNK